MDLILIAIGGLIGLAAFALWIWAIVDCALNEPSQGNDKIVWILVIVFTHWVGALLYLFVRRPRRLEEEERGGGPAAHGS